MLTALYSWLTKGLYYPLVPFVPARLKRIQNLPSGPFDIWFQAVSVGEVAVAEALVGALLQMAPGLRILVTSTTLTGLDRARKTLGHRVEVAPYVFDFPQLVKAALERVAPRIFSPIETELWPNMILEASGRGTHLLLVNARISPFSFPRYRRLRPFMAEILRRFSAFLAISSVHAQRLEALGAHPGRIHICGNAKFEGLSRRITSCDLGPWFDLLDLSLERPVFVVGSLRQGEQDVLAQSLKALFEAVPSLFVIIAPRHLTWLEPLQQSLRGQGLDSQLLSELRSGVPRRASVIVVDEIGHLFCLYGLARVAFVGGSLIPKGGQNLLEPAAWGVPVLYGPYTSNFEEARGLLEDKGGGQVVRSSEDLTKTVLAVLSGSSESPSGEKAREAAQEASGAATRQAGLILEYLSARRP